MAQLSVKFDENDRQKIRDVAQATRLSEASVVRFAVHAAIVNGLGPFYQNFAADQEAQRREQKAS